MLVVVMRGKNLVARDLNGLSDPYVKVSIRDRVLQTKYVENNLNPDWGEEFSFSMSAVKGMLMFEVWDHDTVGRDDFMGMAVTKLDDLEPGKTVERWLALDGRSEKETRQITGEILVQVTRV
eukprot:TRINITY_DN4059_c0_g1_i4.p2 TRINITY_DN4059_c0_g1~~TRINITY_DN4059_c0_g1_i4.p2  ORF type:complete len:122 (-),score=38.15 TRINITY_DN4059_c0_g1_i4:157-522(-)